MPRGDQLSRQWRLLQMIDRPHGVTVDDAARDLACTIRTIWRDLDALQKAGFPLYTERAASASRDGEDTRSIDPYHLTLHNGGLYLVGRCHLRGALRIFAVERMRAVELTARRFAVPTSFDARACLEGAWGILRGDLVTVRVLFARSLAPYIRERLWHPSQKLRDLPDGRVEITLTVADTLEVRRWIMGYGVQAEVVAPEALREALRAEAEALADRLGARRKPLAPVAMAEDSDAAGRRRRATAERLSISRP